MDTGLLIQYLIIAVAVLVSAWVVLKKQFPGTVRKARGAIALGLVKPQRAAWEKFRNPASRFSLVGVFVSQGGQGSGGVPSVRVAVTGAGPCVFREDGLEKALAASWTQAACDAVKEAADGLNSDLHGSAAYRAALIPVLAGRAVAAS